MKERHTPGVGFTADTSSDIVYLSYIYDELCRRFKFVHSALNSECGLVECVASHGLCISPMKSPTGRNAVTCSLRYGVSPDRFLFFSLLKDNFENGGTLIYCRM